MPGWWNGIHAGFKNPWAQACEGSTPSPGTITYYHNQKGPSAIASKGLFFMLTVELLT